MVGGVPTNCVPDPVLGAGLVRVPHVDGRCSTAARTAGPSALTAINGGAMNGFIDALPPTPRWCVDRAASECARYLGPEGQPDVMSYLTRQEHPELLGLRGRVRAAGPDVRADRRLDPARAPVPRLGLVRLLLRPERPDVVHLRRRPQGGTRAVRVRRGPDLRVDRHHVAARSRGRVVGLLRRSRDLFVPTVPRPGARRRRGVDHGDEEPAARVHGPARDGPAGPHPRLPATSSGAPLAGRSRRSRGSCRATA